MFAPVLQHVEERIPNLARRAQNPRMVSVAPDPSATSEDSVHRLGDSNRQSLDAATDADSIGFGQHVHVIRLDAEVKDSEARVRRITEGPPNDSENVLAAKRRETASGTERHVNRTMPIVQRPASVRDTSAAR